MTPRIQYLEGPDLHRCVDQASPGTPATDVMSISKSEE